MTLENWLVIILTVLNCIVWYICGRMDGKNKQFAKDKVLMADLVQLGAKSAEQSLELLIENIKFSQIIDELKAKYEKPKRKYTRHK